VVRLDRPTALLEWLSKYSLRSMSLTLYHSRQCGIILKPRSDRTNYTAVCFMAHDCSRKNANKVPAQLQAKRGLR